MNSADLIRQESLLYRAPYVVPVASPLIVDGGVLVCGGRIVAVDRFSRLQREAARVVELDDRIITPALINCHTHLELSHLAALGHEERFFLPAGGITAWIRALLAQRAEAVPDDTIIRAGQRALDDQRLRGVALVADIGNQEASLAIGGAGRTETLFFHEVLGLTDRAAQTVLAALPPNSLCTVHAPYSCHPRLIQAVKERARQAGRLFPVHVAESADEVEFLQSGTGPFRDFLAERLRLAGALSAGQALAELVAIPACGAVEYLHALGVLDAQTICVHAVHISAHEADLLAQTKARVCLCPGSNRRLGVGKVKIERLTQRQILPGLGTDSLASNDGLDLWQEMMLLQEDHPGLDPGLIFSMATLGGAETLQVSHRLGALVPGREAKLLAIAFAGATADVYPHLVNAGTASTVEWLEADHER